MQVCSPVCFGLRGRRCFIVCAQDAQRRAEAALHSRERGWLIKRAMALSDELHQVCLAKLVVTGLTVACCVVSCTNQIFYMNRVDMNPEPSIDISSMPNS